MEFKKLSNPWGYGGNWYESREDFDGENELIVTAKVYEEPSCYGINGGKISKLEIRVGSEVIANYNRGWDIQVPEEAQMLYESILTYFE